MHSASFSASEFDFNVDGLAEEEALAAFLHGEFDLQTGVILQVLVERLRVVQGRTDREVAASHDDVIAEGMAYMDDFRVVELEGKAIPKSGGAARI